MKLINLRNKELSNILVIRKVKKIRKKMIFGIEYAEKKKK